MRRSAGLFLLILACSDGIGPGTQYYNLSQVQAEAVVETLVAAGVGPLMPLVPQEVSSGLVQLPVTASTPCAPGGGITLAGTIRGTAAAGAASLLLSVGQSVSACVIEIEGKTYTLNSVPVLSIGGFANYVAGVLLGTQSLFFSGTVQVIGDQNAQAICPVDLNVTITNSSSPVRVRGNICGRGVDQTVAV